MENRIDTKRIFNKVLQRQIPEVIRNSGSNILIGTVITYNSLIRTAVIKSKISGQVISGAKVSKQISILRVGDEVVIISPDAKFANRNYIIASFGGNYQNTVDTA